MSLIIVSIEWELSNSILKVRVTPLYRRVQRTKRRQEYLHSTQKPHPDVHDSPVNSHPIVLRCPKN